MRVGHLGFRGRVESAAQSLQAHTKDLAQFSNGTFHFLSAPPLWKAFFVLSSMALSESVIFASIRGVGIAILLIIDPRNHFSSQSLRSIQKQGCRNPYSSKWGCRNLPFIHLGFVGVPLL